MQFSLAVLAQYLLSQTRGLDVQAYIKKKVQVAPPFHLTACSSRIPLSPYTLASSDFVSV